ncbi:hypothetical protein L9F63_026767, partial [Diploptera punctata]
KSLTAVKSLAEGWGWKNEVQIYTGSCKKNTLKIQKLSNGVQIYTGRLKSSDGRLIHEG